MSEVHPNVLFLSLGMAGNDVEYELQKVSRELKQLDRKLLALQQDVTLFVEEIERNFEREKYPKWIRGNGPSGLFFS